MKVLVLLHTRCFLISELFKIKKKKGQSITLPSLFLEGVWDIKVTGFLLNIITRGLVTDLEKVFVSKVTQMFFFFFSFF